MEVVRGEERRGPEERREGGNGPEERKGEERRGNECTGDERREPEERRRREERRADKHKIKMMIRILVHRLYERLQRIPPTWDVVFL